MAVPAIDYTARDFNTIKEALKAHIQSKFPNTWRDMYSSGMGMAWLELVCYAFDILSFYLDVNANETFLPTARDRSSVIRICELVGYKLRPATSASVVCTASISAPQIQDVIIRRGTKVSTPKGVMFETVEDQRIPSGAVEAEVVFVQGQSTVDTFSSTGEPFQKFQLTSSGVAFGSVSLTVDGAPWSEVDSLVYGDEDSEVFAIKYDENDNVYILFGDGTNGRCPFPGAVIEVSYRVGGGEQGNISIGEISQTILGYLDGVVPETSVEVSIQNEERGSGGEERESIQHAKLWAPRWVKTNGRAVTVEDFDTLANTFSDPIHGTVAFAKAKLHQEIPEYNLVDIYVWGRDSEGNITTVSSSLKNSLEEYFDNNGVGAVRIICTDVEVVDGDVVYIDISVGIRVSTDYSSVATSSAVNSAISNLFESDEILPGADFRISRVYQTIQSVLGVDYSILNMITASKRDVEIVGSGDGVKTQFSGTLILDPGLPVVPRTCSIQHGDPPVEVLRDDGKGNIIDGESNTVGSIDYETGEFEFEFSSAPDLNTQVTFEYREVLDFQRGEKEAVADGVTARFQGVVKYPPIVPYVEGMKGIAFSDGVQTVIDDGEGGLEGDIDPNGINRIDYQTGSYDFTFRLAPAVGSEIWSAYRQMLRTSSEDLPLEDNQLAVQGLVEIELL
jgi:uncharacterized phage protein gp47/JayE